MASPLERLKSATDMSLKRIDVELPDATTFSFFSTPLTIGQRQKANREAKTGDANELALRLLIDKARNEDGTPMFASGNYAELKNSVAEKVLEPILLAMLGASLGEDEEDEEVVANPKQSKPSLRKTES